MGWPETAVETTDAAIDAFLEPATHVALDGAETEVQIAFEEERSDVEVVGHPLGSNEPRAYLRRSELGRDGRRDEGIRVRDRAFRVRDRHPDDAGAWLELEEQRA